MWTFLFRSIMLDNQTALISNWTNKLWKRCWMV
jgi:hypothetical protein